MKIHFLLLFVVISLNTFSQNLTIIPNPLILNIDSDVVKVKVEFTKIKNLSTHAMFFWSNQL
jgi:hypothetical protein